MKLTKKQVLADFREMWNEFLQSEPQWKGDSIAKREAFNNYTDSLCKDGLITDYQYHNWTNPF